MRIKVRYIIITLLIAIVGSVQSFAQSADEQLAVQYFQNKEYDKALVYYEKLFNKQSLPIYYENYLNCLLQTKDFKKAEKVAKSQLKRSPYVLSYAVDLGLIYRVSGDESAAKDQFEKSIKSLGPSQEQAFLLANAFMKIKEWDYAIATYKRAQRLLGDMYPFNFELAEVYAAKNDVASMINEYLDVLEINEGYIQNVQNALQTNVGAETDIKKNELIKNELIKRIQRDPDKTIFSELLIWMQMQQRDFEGAFIHAKALDKRKKEEGTRIMGLAQVSASNENYDLAVKAYEYVIAKGSYNYHYINARMELLDVMHKKIVQKKDYSEADILSLEKNYNATLKELGKYAAIAPMMKNYAHLLAFYLHKTDSAIALLQETVALPQLNINIQADCKLELGDILLMSGDIWEASLIYSQVEKAFKYDPIGQEAKFRNARISYYTGDFKWSQAQLDVLKGATSKLIANDAMNLSLIISDNLSIDTNTIPLQIFARADLLFFQNKDKEAMEKLDSINSLFPSHALSDDILYKRAHVMMKRKDFEKAAALLENIISSYSYDILADDAMYELAEMNETIFNNKEKAMELYQDIMIKFPGSMYTVEARKRFRAMRGDTVN